MASRALELAGLADYVSTLSLGLDSPIWASADGPGELSGGQWQRLMLARAFYGLVHGRQILVLDEPTAQMDVTAEAQFFGNVIRVAPARCVLIVSHRLSTVMKADRIYCLDRGSVVEQGTHSELMALSGVYAKMFIAQSSRFVSEQ